MLTVCAHQALIACASDGAEAAAVALHIVVHLGRRLLSAAACAAVYICLLRLSLGHSCNRIFFRNELGRKRSIRKLRVQGPQCIQQQAQI